MKISDSQLAAILGSRLDGNGTATIVPRNSKADAFGVRVELEVIDTHRRDSPDILLWVHLVIEHPQMPKLKLKVPIPIEGEKAGIPAAMEDLRKFAERGHFPISMPMVVVGGEGNPARSSATVQLAAKVDIVQIPYRSIAE